MKSYKTFLALVVLTMWGACPSFAQTAAPPPSNATAPPSAPVARSEAELQKLVAPIALYPDPLLAILLPASAYPIEIVQAARFVKETNNIPKLDSQPWDENVKALASFPDVIAKMDADIGWTSQLGQAFVDNQKEVMDAIQVMRGKAQQAGTLKSTPQQVVATTNEVVQKVVEQQVVYVTNTIVQIQPAQPQVLYVPTYNPNVVYAPAPAYAYPYPYAYDPVAPLVTFGVGVAVGAAIANNCDWHSGGVYWGGGHYHGDVDINRNVNINQNVNSYRGANGQRWTPDPNRRTATATASTAEARGWSGQASQNASAARAQASQNAAAARSQASQNAAAARSQASQNASAARAQASQRASSPRSQSASAFNSSGGAAQARAASSRGSFSRGGGGGRRR